MRQLLNRGIIFIFLILTHSAFAADQWPSKPFHLVVGFTTGGPSDIIARGLGQKLSQILGQPVVVENKPGAGGNLAAEYVANSEPDGYTWLLGNNSILATNEFLYKNLRYQPERDFAAVGLVAIQPNILVVNNDLPVNNLQELIALLKKNPNKYNFASSGAGAAAHLSGELFKTSANVKITHIPYKGAQPALTDVIAGHVDMMFATSGSVLPFIKAHKVRALAVTGLSKMRDLPEIPTMSEAGLPGFEAITWHGLVVPKATSQPVLLKISQALSKALADKELMDSFLALGLEPKYLSPTAFDEFIHTEIPKWSKVVQESGAKLN
jgi:tripartite-type tricarboxylate transporter receptor subunit TctC